MKDGDQLEYGNKRNNILKWECIIEEVGNPIDITRITNFEKPLKTASN